MTEPAENQPYRVRRARLMILGGVYDTPAAIDELAGRLLPDIQELPTMDITGGAAHEIPLPGAGGVHSKRPDPIPRRF